MLSQKDFFNLGKALSTAKWSPVLKASLFVGLFEALLITRYDAAINQGPPFRMLDLLYSGATIAALHVSVWMLLSALFTFLLRDPQTSLRLIISVWGLASLAVRESLRDQFGAPAHPLLFATLGLVWLVPRSWLGRLTRAQRALVLGTALIAISTYSLWGRAPSFDYPGGRQAWLYATSIAVAFLAVQMLFLRPQVTLATAAVLAVGAAASPRLRTPAVSDHPNVVFILIDTARRDHISPFGKLVQTPAIDRLAGEGVLFEDAVTVIPRTSQSVASFLTGRYPKRHGLRVLHDSLDPSQPHLAKLFQDAGYRTAAFVNNPWLSKKRGFGRGFDVFYSTTEMHRAYGGGLRFVSWFVLFDRLTNDRIGSPPGIREVVYNARASTVTDAAARYLRDVDHKPFFLYVHYFQPHPPYLPSVELERRYGAPPGKDNLVNFVERTEFDRGRLIFDNPLPESENEGARRLYRGDMDETLSEVGRLLGEIERRGYRDETIVVFTADHGHSLGDHDYSFHHGDFLYESSVRIPLIIRWPENLPAGLVVGQQVRSIDVAPSLLELARVPAALPMDGTSLTSLWDGASHPSLEAYLESDVKEMAENTRRTVVGVLGKLRAVRNGRFKLVMTPSYDGPIFELYDLLQDPGEQHNLAEAKEHHQVFSELLASLITSTPAEERAAFTKIDRAAIEGKPDGESVLGKNDRELLRALGYIN